MLIDLHNHTTLCNHANGTIEEYIEKAIERKIDHFGFSDHAPMAFDEKYRMGFASMKEYEKNILHVRDKYKDKIEILLAYEVDYLDGYLDDRVLESNVDYLIGSVHFIGKWGFDNPEFIGGYKNQDINKIWQDYFDAIEAMAKTNLFNIVGHIDLIKIFNFLPTKEIKSIAHQAIKAIKKADMTVEINAAGFRKPIGEPYPSTDIMELLSEYDIPITFGSDAHEIEQIGFKQEEIRKYARNYGYKKCATFFKKERQMVNF